MNCETPQAGLSGQAAEHEVDACVRVVHHVLNGTAHLFDDDFARGRINHEYGYGCLQSECCTDDSKIDCLAISG